MSLIQTGILLRSTCVLANFRCIIYMRDVNKKAQVFLLELFYLNPVRTGVSWRTCYLDILRTSGLDGDTYVSLASPQSWNCAHQSVHIQPGDFQRSFYHYPHIKNINLMPQYERENELMNDRTRIQYAGARFRDWAEASDSYFYLLDNGP